MKKVVIILAVILLFGASAFGFWFVRGRQAALAALQVTSIPKASVFFDGKELGKTPFRDNVPSGEHSIKVQPEGASTFFEQKLSFLPNILTVIDRAFDQAGSSGYTLSLSPLFDRKEVQVTVISTPSGAAVTLDSELRGITPLALTGVTASDHELIVTKEGFEDKIIRIKAVSGYKLLVNTDLVVRISPTPTPESELTPTPISSPSSQISTQSAQLVRIGKTPNNFLRVRAEPSLSAREITRVKPNETFPLLDEIVGWLKIRLPDGREGWVSSQYAEEVSE